MTDCGYPISMKKLIKTVVALALFAGSAYAAYANSNLTCYMYGDSWATYKIELFEVGAPYPSRQNIGVGTVFSPTWYSLVTYQRNYFIRVTRNGVAKQSGTFWMPDNRSLWVRVYWSRPYLGMQLSW